MTMVTFPTALSVVASQGVAYLDKSSAIVILNTESRPPSPITSLSFVNQGVYEDFPRHACKAYSCKDTSSSENAALSNVVFHKDLLTMITYRCHGIQDFTWVFGQEKPEFVPVGEEHSVSGLLPF